MIRTLLSAVAAVALASSAMAADAPVRTKAGSAPAPVLAPTTPSDTTEISVGFGLESDKGTYDTANKAVYKIGIEQNAIGGLFLGANFQTSQVQPDNGALSQNIEGLAGYKFGMGPVALKGSLGLGERFTNGNNFPYYVGRLGADYKIDKNITWNAVQYRYRNAFDTVNAYQSHQIGTGLTYNIAPSQAIYANIYRNLDSAYNVTDNGVEMGLKVSF